MLAFRTFPTARKINHIRVGFFRLKLAHFSKWRCRESVANFSSVSCPFEQCLQVNYKKVNFRFSSINPTSAFDTARLLSKSLFNASWLAGGKRYTQEREPVVVQHGNTSIIHATSEGLDEVGHVLRCGGDMESTLGAGEAPKRNLGPICMLVLQQRRHELHWI